MIGVLSGWYLQAAHGAAEYAPPTDIKRAGRSAQVLWHRDDAARALDEDSVVDGQGESSDWLWAMPGLPQPRQGAGGAGLIALEAG